MDRKQLTTAIALSALVFSLWLWWNHQYEKSHPRLPEAQTAVTPATQPAESAPQTGPTSGPSTQSATVRPDTIAPAPGLLALPPASPPIPVSIGSLKGDSKFVLQVELTPEGASIADVTLNQFKAPDNRTSRKEILPLYQFEAPYHEHPETAALATRSVMINKKTIELWNKVWTNGENTPDSATYFIIVADEAGHPLARVTKTFKIDPNPAAMGYQVGVTQTIENLSGGKSDIGMAFNGTVGPPSETEAGTDRYISVGYAEPGGQTVKSATQFTASDFKPDSPADAPPKNLTIDNSRRFVWVGQTSAYFGAIIVPDASINPDITIAADSKEQPVTDPPSKLPPINTFTLNLKPKALEHGEMTTAALSVFFGPKWRAVIAKPYYSAYPHQFDVLLSQQSQGQGKFFLFAWCGSICSICQWPWLVNVLVTILGFFHSLFRDWGLAIVCLVMLVRVMLHPITKRSQVKMMSMGKLAPEVEKLKKKYADQPDVLNREMMKLYKQQGGAILGCLPMFLQTPIWIALWTALQGTFELRQAPLFYGFTWIKDLSKPDALFHFSQPIKILFFTIYAVNLLPLLMACVTYINQKYFMPVPLAATPEQEQQQKMQRGMSLIFPLMFYSFPSGLNLYYLTSMSLGIVESKIIRDHIKEQEELEKLRGPELVATKASRLSRPGTPEKPAKPGWMDRIMTAIQKAQEQAEELKKQKKK